MAAASDDWESEISEMPIWILRCYIVSRFFLESHCSGSIYFEDENGKVQKEPPPEAIKAVMDATRSGRLVWESLFLANGRVEYLTKCKCLSRTRWQAWYPHTPSLVSRMACLLAWLVWLGCWDNTKYTYLRIYIYIHICRLRNGGCEHVCHAWARYFLKSWFDMLKAWALTR